MRLGRIFDKRLSTSPIRRKIFARFITDRQLLAKLVGQLGIKLRIRIAAPEPAKRRRRARSRRLRRLPFQTKGVGFLFQPAAVCSNQSMISCGFFGCCPASARGTMMRCTDSAIFKASASNGRVERHHPMAKQPSDEIRSQVPCQVVPDQDNSQGRKALIGLMGQEPRFPACIQRALCFGGELCSWVRLLDLGQHLRELLFEPRMQDHVGS